MMVIIQMEKEMEKERNLIVKEIQFLMVNIFLVIGEKAKNILKEYLSLKVNFYLIKVIMELVMIYMEI